MQLIKFYYFYNKIIVMMKRIKYLIVLPLLFFTISGFAQNHWGVYKQIGFRDCCYDSEIKTARVFKTGNELADNIITLNSSETLTLMFDDLSSNPRRYYYTITHCDADWNEDNLALSDYMIGFAETPINDINYSKNTRVSYSNVSLTIPNHDIHLKISGNYLIKVFDDNTKTLLLQKGFSLVEQMTSITPNIRNTASNSSRCVQQLEFKVNHSSLNINDAFMDLKVRIEQNSARANGVENPTLAFTQPGVTDYTRPDRNIFPGLNEFRSFDIRNTSFMGMGVSSIRVEQGIYRVLLKEDFIKENSRYLANKDNNGKYVIGSNMTYHPNTEADYAEVFFTLIADNPFINGRVFLISEFTDWNIDNRYEMIYNPMRSQYEATISLKQGYYNYRYVLLKNDGTVEIQPLEGCFAETENDYNIFVYYRSFTDRYDRLVGYRHINSHTVVR